MDPWPSHSLSQVSCLLLAMSSAAQTETETCKSVLWSGPKVENQCRQKFHDGFFLSVKFSMGNSENGHAIWFLVVEKSISRLGVLDDQCFHPHWMFCKL